MFGEGVPRIIDSLSMGCFGLFEQGIRGGICLPVMGAGATLTDVLSAGETKAFGRLCWKNLL